MSPLSRLLLILVLAAAPASFLAVPGGAVPGVSLEEVIARTGRAVGFSWRQLSAVTCTESVTQEKIDPRGKIEYKRDSVFDYLVLINIQGEDVTVDESRRPQKKSGKSKDPSLLTTSGFPALLLIFHACYQASYRYRLDGVETVEGKELMRIRFEHISGTRSTSALELRGRPYPLELQGTAWVDPEQGIIHKVVAELMSPMEGQNLRVFYTKVEYKPLRFSSTAEIFWLPTTASIDVETARQHWRNTHRFSNYRRFFVTSERR